MFRMNLVSRAALAVCVGSLGFNAAAQTDGSAELKRVEVTGSRIKRVDAEGTSAVQVITRDQIERSGATTLTDVMKSVPANNAGAFDESQVNGFTPGAGGVSLRGLGAQATLVLINGRRVTPFGFGSGGQQTFVDINSIPLDAVERVETLLDGASAIYGSDAMAGVVNVILRKDFTGFVGSASYGVTTNYKDAQSPAVSLTFGKGSLATDKYNVFVNYSHSERSAVYAKDRPNTFTANYSRLGLGDFRSSDAYPGNLYNVPPNGRSFIGAAPGCDKVVNDPADGLNGRCVYEFTDFVAIVPKTKRDSLLLAGTLDLGGGNELFGDASFTRNDFYQRSSSYSSNYFAGLGYYPNRSIVLPVGHPQNPYPDKEIGIRYRFADVPNDVSSISNTQRLVAGVRGTWFKWDAETAIMLSRSNTDLTNGGFVNDLVLLDEVLDADGKARTSFQFGKPGANNAGLMARLYPQIKSNGTTSTSSVDLRGSRDLMQLANGPLSIAIGGELRNEAYTTTPDPLAATGAISAISSPQADGRRNINALYAELSIPLFRTVETQLAVRRDEYSDFGSAVTPKAAIKWKALSNLAFRATYSEGFRAPSLNETSSGINSYFQSVRDPKLCPDPSAADTNTNCSVSVQTFYGANPSLKPEHSKSTSYGIVYEPVDNLSITLDTYNIKRTDNISNINSEYLLANESRYPGQVVRNPDGTLKEIRTLLSNLGSTQVMGYDLDVKYKFNAGENGKVTLEGSYNTEPTWNQAEVPGGEETNYAGTWSQPTQRAKFGATWEKGAWTTSVALNITGGYLKAFTPADLSCQYSTGPNPQLCSVRQDRTVDIFIGYKGYKNLDLGMSIINFENMTPPIDANSTSTLFNSTYSSGLGRYVSLRAKYKFW